MPILAEKQRLFTVDEYHAMGEAGILTEDDRVELLDGQIIAMSPIGPPHIHTINHLLDLFARRLYAQPTPPARLSIQNPVRLNRYSEPEPDVVLLRTDAPQDRMPAPEDVLLLIEVSNTSLSYDRNVKAPHYAAAGIPEYWIVAVVAGYIDVFRAPSAGRYTQHTRKQRGDRLDVTALPDLDALDISSVLGAAA